VRYCRKRRDDTADRELLRALAAERRRFGYRRLREMAKRKGRRMNLKKVACVSTRLAASFGTGA
jgi:putative transposase